MSNINFENELKEKNKKFYKKALDIPGKLNAAIVYPHNVEAIEGAILAAEIGLVNPLFFGSIDEMEKLAKKLGKSLSKYECFDLPDSVNAAEKAVEIVKNGKAEAIVKGSLDTAILLKPIISKTGLGCVRRISNCYICDVPLYHKPIIYTDVGINVSPDVKIKKDIILNAIEVANSLGISKPKIALLSCIEKVKDYIPSTIDADELCKIKGEFGNVIMEGPLSFDIALSKQVAEEKSIKSEIAGDPDILVFPNLDAGNIAVKELEFFGKAQCGSLALGSKVPVLINSRNTPATERVLSCIFAKIYYNWLRSNKK